MKRAFALAAAWLCCAASPPEAQGWLVDGRPAPPEPEMAQSGDLAMRQMASDDPDGVEAAWAKDTPGADLPTTTETVRNKLIVTYLVFTGCHPATDGNCNVTVDFLIKDPKGRRYGAQNNAPVWIKPPPRPGILFLSDAALGLRVEKGERLGDYVVQATTTDHVSGTTVHTQETSGSAKRVDPLVRHGEAKRHGLRGVADSANPMTGGVIDRAGCRCQGAK